MNKTKFKLNSKGVQELLKSPQMQSILRARGEEIAAKAGAGYASDVHTFKKRAVAQVFPNSAEAAHDNYEHNTLLKAMGR